MTPFLTNYRAGAWGLFIAPPGVDVMTAADADLLLDISRKTPQFVQIGSASNADVVPLPSGLTFVPYVLLTSYGDVNGTVGNNNGVVRPHGNPPTGTNYAKVTVSSSSMSFYSDFASVGYMALRPAV